MSKKLSDATPAVARSWVKVNAPSLTNEQQDAVVAYIVARTDWPQGTSLGKPAVLAAIEALGF